MNELYIELIKKTLIYSLWPDPGVPIDRTIDALPFWKRIPLMLLRQYLSVNQLKVYLDREVSQQARDEGRIWPAFAHTMIGLERLNNIQYCVETVIREGIEGDFLEAGVWRGGASIFMRALLSAHNIKDRRVFVADSFAGLPKPNAELYPQDAGDTHHTQSFLAVGRTEVESNFRKYDLLDEQVVFLEGWFKDTLPNASIRQLSVMRLDGDMYESTIDVLSALYSRLAVGGFCIVDDYSNLSPCKQAVEDFRKMNGIEDPIIRVDWTGVYWRKTR
jgi:hypothetical protein